MFNVIGSESPQEIVFNSYLKNTIFKMNTNITTEYAKKCTCIMPKNPKYLKIINWLIKRK